MPGKPPEDNFEMIWENEGGIYNEILYRSTQNTVPVYYILLLIGNFMFPLKIDTSILILNYYLHLYIYLH